MKFKTVLATLTMVFVGFCSADVRVACGNERLFLTINDPTNSLTNILFLDSFSQVLYEFALEPELHPNAVLKNVLIDFSSNPTIIKDLSFDESGKVISSGTETHKSLEYDKTPLSVVITDAQASNEMATSFENQCSSSLGTEFFGLLEAFLKAHNDFQLENSRIVNMAEISEDEAKERASHEINQLMHFSGYRKGSFGVYIPINDTATSY